LHLSHSESGEIATMMSSIGLAQRPGTAVDP
jgi:hypothetical protein